MRRAKSPERCEAPCGPSTEKTKRARRLRPRAAISQAIRARRNPSPRGSYRSAAWAMASAAPCEAVRARAARPPAASARAAGSVSAVVVTSASMREMAVFIGLISVWDTIGTLPAPGIEIVTLFRPVSCCVMGRKAPRKRLARRVMACPRVPRTHPNVSRRSAAALAKLMNSLGNPRPCHAIPGFFPVCKTGVLTPAQWCRTPTRHAAEAEQLQQHIDQPMARPGPVHWGSDISAGRVKHRRSPSPF